jgi:TolB protein
LALAACGGGDGGGETSGETSGATRSAGAESGEPSGRLAFVSFREGDQEIFVKELPDGEETNLTNDPGDDFDPDISEDGTRIAFVSNREGGTPHVYTMNADGSGLEALAEGTAGAQTPRWSRDGTKIAFALGGAVTVMDADGGNKRTLLEPDGEEVPAPCRGGAFVGGWTPDDSKIVYYSAVADAQEGQICLVPADGGEPEVVLAELGQFLVEPVISPDGRYIVYRAIIDGQHDIWVLDQETGERTNLTNDPALDIEPDWSPDGQWIAFGSLREGAPFFDLFVMRADGSDERQVTTDPAKEANPVWGKSDE